MLMLTPTCRRRSLCLPLSTAYLLDLMSTSNGLTPQGFSKNAAVVRKLFGYTHIPQKWAARLNQSNSMYLYPYINYHRPCFYPEIITDDKGKQRKQHPYKNMMTPYDKLKSLPESENYLKPGVSFAILDQVATKMTDNQADKILKKERLKLFNQIFEQKIQA